MEHAAITFAEAADLCRMASGTGMLTMIRIPDSRRESVLKAAECGPDIIDIPMADTPEQVADPRRLLQASRPRVHAASTPSPEPSTTASWSPGPGHAAAPQHRAFAPLPDRNRHRPQPSRRALLHPRTLTSFIGPSDLAASLGFPGQTSHPARSRSHHRDRPRSPQARQKSRYPPAPPADFIHWTRLGIDLLFCTNDIASLKAGAQLALTAATHAITQAQTETRVPNPNRPPPARVFLQLVI